nr:hypothetical protein [Elizabethkingia sp. ASV34]
MVASGAFFLVMDAIAVGGTGAASEVTTGTTSKIGINCTKYKYIAGGLPTFEWTKNKRYFDR